MTRIKQLMLLKGLKQVGIVSELKCSPSVLSLYLNNWRPLPEKYQESLANILGVSVDEIKNNCLEEQKCKKLK